MTARDDILATIRRGKTQSPPAPAYARKASIGDPENHFIARAEGEAARVHRVAREEDVPEYVAALLRSNERPSRLHIAPGSPLASLGWAKTALTPTTDAPSGEDTALAQADYAVAETGTLVFLSGPGKPASWHFRPGREIVLLKRERLLTQLEDVLAVLPALPATINLVTGPSRTADIEQTIERGAHGPRLLDIVLIG